MRLESDSGRRPFGRMENVMKSRTRLRTMPKNRPELLFAGLAAFVILVCMLIRTIDMLSVH
jgi:hypothetical protein